MNVTRGGTQTFNPLDNINFLQSDKADEEKLNICLLEITTKNKFLPYKEM